MSRRNEPKNAIDKGPYLECLGEGQYNLSYVRLAPAGPLGMRKEFSRVIRPTNEAGALKFALKHKIKMPENVGDIFYGDSAPPVTKRRAKKKNVRRKKTMSKKMTEKNVDKPSVENVEAGKNVLEVRETIFAYDIVYYSVFAHDGMGGDKNVGDLTSKDEAEKLAAKYQGGYVTPQKLTLAKSVQGLEDLKSKDRMRKALAKLSEEDLEALRLIPLAQGLKE